MFIEISALLLFGHSSTCLMFFAGFVTSQSLHNLNLDKCSPYSCTRPAPAPRIGKFTHISDTKPMLDGQCYWMLAHKLCVFRSTLCACMCIYVGV